jgi:AAA family ATP:ADP antiporter
MRRVFGSSYLLSIVAIVGLYELVSTVLDFQFTQAMILFSEDDASRDQNIATVFAITNWLSMTVQLLATSFVMRRFGLGVALMILPGAITMASIGFAWMPSLWLGGLLNTADNAFSYSINQSAKETLYVPTSAAEKYQAKAFIDMFVQRFAKAVGVGLSLFVTTRFVGVDGLRTLSFLVLPVLALWAFAAVYAGKRFKILEQDR